MTTAGWGSVGQSLQLQQGERFPWAEKSFNELASGKCFKSSVYFKSLFFVDVYLSEKARDSTDMMDCILRL